MQVAGRLKDAQGKLKAEHQATAQLGLWHNITASRAQSVLSDHCNTAMAAKTKIAEATKSERSLVKYHGPGWYSCTTAEQEDHRRMHQHGCMHHLRNIGFGNGAKAVQGILKSLLATTVEQAQLAGIRCVTGELGIGLRSTLKFMGNAVDQDHFSVGKAFQQWCADGGAVRGKDGKLSEAKHRSYALIPFQVSGRVDLGNRQDGVSEQSWLVELCRDAVTPPWTSLLSLIIRD